MTRPASSTARRSPTLRTVPFPVVDEIARHCLDEREPETVHIEVHLPGFLDADRLRAAFAQALQRHPRILMREAPRRWWDRRYQWELTEGPDAEVVRFTAGGPASLAAVREATLTEAPPLRLSPPVRVEAVQPAGKDSGSGSVLVVTLNHTALDGPACMRVLATAAEIYSGRTDPPAAAPARLAPVGDPGSVPALSPWARPARIARGAGVSRRGGGTGNGGPARTGTGMIVAELDVPARPKGAPYTVNDQLMVATALTLADWNRRLGAPARPLRVTMPVDDRDRGPGMPIGNGTRLVEVPFLAEELDGERGPDTAELLRLTAERTRTLKAVRRPQLGRGAALLTSPYAPVAVRAALTRGLRWLAGPWTSTVLLSNIGRVAYPLDFGEAGRASAVWFSAPVRAPRGLSITTASTGGRLHVALRWSKAMLGPEDGRELLEAFTRRLAGTAVGIATSVPAPTDQPGASARTEQDA